MSAAVFGLIGVLLGGLLTGFVNLGLVKRQERRAAQASSRLLEEELEPIPGALYRLRAGLHSQQEDEVNFAIERLDKYSFTAWERERALLAGAYSAPDWYTVMKAHVALARLIARMKEGPAQRSHWLRGETVPYDLQRIESDCSQALGTLGHWGGNKPLPGKIIGKLWADSSRTWDDREF